MYWRFYFSGHLDWEYIPKVSNSFREDFLISDLSHITEPTYSVSVVENWGD